MYRTILLSCLIFAASLPALIANGALMFGDPDTGWHLATGDLIRSTGSLPQTDPWSFTAGNTPWIIMSWAWDAATSYCYELSGWHGVIAMHSLVIAALYVLLFAAAFIRSQDATAAFLATLLASVTLTLNIRPTHVTFLMTAILALLLAQAAHGKCSKRWLLAVPPIMALWVNSHGGFIFGFFLMGIHGLSAIWQKDKTLTLWLLATGVASLAACCLNPYGIGYFPPIMELASNQEGKPYIDEWAPLSFSLSNANLILYCAAFVIIVTLRRLQAPVWEKVIAYSAFAFGMISIRNIPFFAVVSLPLLATGLRDAIIRKGAGPPKLLPFVARLQAWASRIAHSGRTSAAAVAGCLALSVWVFSAQAVAFFADKPIMLPPDLSQEIAFIEKHHPKARLLNPYNLGGPLIFYTRGQIPVFIDGRERSAFPKEVVRDYFIFRNGSDGWEEVLDRYRIDGVIAGRQDGHNLPERFTGRPGWRLAFEGPEAMIFMRDGVGN